MRAGENPLNRSGQHCLYSEDIVCATKRFVEVHKRTARRCEPRDRTEHEHSKSRSRNNIAE